MMILVDTAIWSLAFRRRAVALAADDLRRRDELEDLIRERRAALIGPVRQEVLSGIRDAKAFERLRMALRAFVDLPIATADYEEAARVGNACRAQGIAGSPIDILISAIASRRKMAIFTTDRDFEHLARIVPLLRHDPRARRS